MFQRLLNAIDDVGLLHVNRHFWHVCWPLLCVCWSFVRVFVVSNSVLPVGFHTYVVYNYVTEIAERRRSLFEMCARYRSAGYRSALHWRGWTNAGWMASLLQQMLAGWPHCCNCAMSRKYSCFCTTLRKTARCLLHHCILPASLQLRTGPTRATCSLGHANCEDSGSAIWKTWVEEEGRKLWGGGTERRSAGPSAFASVFSRRCRHA